MASLAPHRLSPARVLGVLALCAVLAALTACKTTDSLDPARPQVQSARQASPMLGVGY